MSNDDQLRAGCTRFLRGHGRMDPADHLAAVAAALPVGVQGDTYGAGGVVSELEAEVAAVLGTAAVAFMPTGTMAQQIALRIHADARGRRTVLLHPTAHPALHEGQAAERLHGLHLRPVGQATAPLSPADLEAVAEPPAAVLLELPQRELGGVLPTWGALAELVGWARDRGAAVHLDGARLWACGPAYDRPLSAIAALFDSTYVSFYKDLGGVAGAALAGSADLVGQAREWRHRHGGALYGMWPLAASALAGLRRHLPQMAAYTAHAVAIAAALEDVEGVEVRVNPVTPFLHLDVRVDAATWRDRTRDLAAAEGVWTWTGSQPTERPAWRRVELPVGEATLGFDPQEVADLLAALIGPSPTSGG